MKIITIDSCRENAWNIAYGAEQESLFNPELDLPALDIGSIDFVCAHTHDQCIGEETDLYIGSDPCDYVNINIVQSLCELIQDLPDENKPIVVLYSGNSLNNASARDWIYWTRCDQGPLPGYPEDKVVCITNFAVTRDVTPENLAQAFNPYFGLTSEELSEPQYAFRLLCEAYQYTGEENINKPSSLDDWLNPFKSGETEQTIDSVSALMGQQEEQVKSILGAMNTNPVNCEMVNTAIEEFMKSNN